MRYKIELIPYFKKRAKRLIKKFPSLKNELFELGQKLSNEPSFGHSLGNNYGSTLILMDKDLNHR